MKTITLEEHFVTRDFLKATGGDRDDVPGNMRMVRERLLDVGAGRIAAMDEGGVDLQVLSLAALGFAKLNAEDEAAIMHDVHDEAAAAVKAYPERFAAFATPGLKRPEKAVQELERCVRELGFRGLLVNGTTDGKFLDAPEFSGLPGPAGHLLSIAGWGWHAENGLHLLRLIVAGVLERLPKLQVIMGHMGEGVPYALARSNAVLSAATKGQRSVLETVMDQVHVTTSGYFTVPPFTCCREVVGLERMMYSVDYPFSSNTQGKEYLERLQLSEDERAAFVGGNAARVLGL